MSLDRYTLEDATERKTIAALGHTPGAAAALNHSADGPVCLVREASLAKCPLPCEGGKFAAFTCALTDAERNLRTSPCDSPENRVKDLWDSPVTPAQDRRQRGVAVVLAFALAALLGQIGL